MPSTTAGEDRTTSPVGAVHFSVRPGTEDGLSTFSNGLTAARFREKRNPGQFVLTRKVADADLPLDRPTAETV